MKTIETPEHLFQTPKYRVKHGNWNPDFQTVLNETPERLNIDLAAIQAYLSFGFVTGNRTLLKEMKKQPWLSETSGKHEVELKEVPPHGFWTESSEILAQKLFFHLVNEARSAVKNYEQIYVLLTGGLDSRIVAGVLKFLYDNGEIKNNPVALTWGLEDSRDVDYGKLIAGKLCFEWQHVPMSPEVVLSNIQAGAKDLGLIHSPEMLHSMLWLKKLPPSSIIFAGSFGDSIGRAEFGGLHLLQLRTPEPIDQFNLLGKDFIAQSAKGVKKDIDDLFARSPKSLSYMQNEHFMQGYRMRNGLCHALSIINGNAKLYQMFTSPEVYKFMWSIHPSRRDNDIYASLLENYFPKLARIPWARTNKALIGKTVGARKDLRPQYHQYTKWSQKELKSELEKLVDFDWFSSIGIFNIEGIRSLRETVRKSEARVGRTNDIWLWLAGFRVYIDHLEKIGKKIAFFEENEIDNKRLSFNKKKKSTNRSFSASYLNRSSFLNSMAKNIRNSYRKRELKKVKEKYIQQYPPQKFDKS